MSGFLGFGGYLPGDKAARKTEIKLRCFGEGGVGLCSALHLSLSISVTLCLPLISLLTHSPHPLLLDNEIKNDLRSCLCAPPPSALQTLPPSLSFVSPPSPSSPVLFLPLLAVLEECVRAAQKNKSLTGGGGGGGRERERGLQSCVR